MRVAQGKDTEEFDGREGRDFTEVLQLQGQGKRTGQWGGVAQIRTGDKGGASYTVCGKKQVSSAGDGNGNDVNRSFSANEEAGNFRLAKFAWRRNVL